MRKIFIATLLSLSFLNLHAADSERPQAKNVFWKCNTVFRAKARGFTVVGLGKYELGGHGEMSCHPLNLTKPSAPEEKREVIRVNTKRELDALNDNLDTLANNPVEVKMPVKMTFVSSPFQIGATLGRVYVEGFSHSYTLTKDINELIGAYKVAGVSGTIGLGLGGFVAVKLGKKALSLNLSLQVLQGFGGSFGFSSLLVELDEAK